MTKILLIDDDEKLGDLLKAYFDRFDLDLTAAVDPAAGLKLLESTKPDLVILDIQMPGLNGIEVLRQMKMINSSVPIILSSAYHEYKQDLGAWASDDYVVKSSDLTDLKNAVRRLLDE